MRVVLFQSVPSVGLAGEVVDVKPGFFRNYLEPRGYAMRETPGALRLLSSKKKKIEQALLQERSQAQEAERAIGEVVLTFRLKAGEKGRLFGSVTNRDIADALQQRGIEVDRHKIELPDSIKSIGSHKARIRLHPEVVGELTVVVEAENPEVLAKEAKPAEAAASGEGASAPAESVPSEEPRAQAGAGAEVPPEGAPPAGE